ncbi:D-2-hydroxyacid dehydrogenase [Telmatospirillum siberiense]|uniref:D-2-hydroxyacid dehydrogenase n=1 Tax=Telmatospirillum siberiense TaxID=382514 RepID=A0A2N3PQ37_9PROT|nr:D-2-hydroxyacid dehydrogenase [Telmatospirillum siberiense]PKU22507.1 D-2-hydroxyacid dehydrogenase [Telmatospirillum siberiense]
MRILFAGPLACKVAQNLADAGPLVDYESCGAFAELIDRLPGADAIVIQNPGLDEGRALMAALSDAGNSVRWIQVVTAGYETLASLGVPEGIVVTNQGGAVAPVVAEHALALVLAQQRRLSEVWARSSRKEWNKTFLPPIAALEGQTVTVLGYGHVGRNLASRAKAFDARVIGVTRRPHADPFADEMHPLSALPEILPQSDVLAVTIALTPETRHIVGASELALLKPGAVLVNVSRGGTVDPGALADALHEGRLSAALLDVTEPEPLPPESPLWQAPNLVISPHVAGAGSARVIGRICAVVADNIGRYRAGAPLANQVHV